MYMKDKQTAENKTHYWKRSPITGRKYDYFDSDTIRIINFEQSFAYINAGVVPLDIVMSTDRKNPNKKIVLFIFSRSETEELYQLWCDGKLEKAPVIED